ncbi:MFS transporter [Labrys monachus]|uniref:EmrB/QacA subfamily drug resistance transporter n=1 Tax=Labrys monachus TaxID=217067 RepID=A0ABU0FHE1_9HYPH|nr:MFS transporter [Labrys monachus]MDQ0393543.1 EmrB/QacA subfamily drug resistance transporter [Labrys monachus]
MTPASSSRNHFALVAVCLSALMLGLEITSVPSILPTLESLLPADFRQLQWIMNAYTITMCAVLMAMGALGDRFGRKRIFMSGIAVFAMASLICGLAINAPLLIAARFLQGLSAAAMLACQVAVLSHQFRNGAERGKAFGWWGIVFGVGLGFGPIVGGAIITLASWQWVFLIHGFIAVVTLLCALKGVEESSDPNAIRIDFAGMTTLSLAVFGVVYLITQGQTLGLTSPLVLTILALSIVSFLLFVLIENRIARPMFDFSAFRVRKFSGALLGSSGMNFSFWPFVIYLPIYLKGVLGYDAITAGLTVLAYTLPTIVVPPLAERLLLRRGPGFVIPLGLLTIGAGFAVLHVAITSGNAHWQTLLPGCILAGIGLGLTNTPVTNTATAAVPPERAGMASGMDMSARMISLAVNIALMGFILLTGVSAYLVRALPDVPSDVTLRALADVVSAGNLSAAENFGFPVATARDALAHGIGWVTLYAATCACGLSALSFLAFGRRKAMRADASSR